MPLDEKNFSTHVLQHKLRLTILFLVLPSHNLESVPISGLRVRCQYKRDAGEKQKKGRKPKETGGLREVANTPERIKAWGREYEVKRFVHPEVGMLELNCQSLLDPDQSHRLLVYTAVPGTESHEKLRLLSVIGLQTLG